MNKFKKISAAITTAAVLAAAPVTGVLPDVLSVTASAYTYDKNGLYIKNGVLVSVSQNVTSVVIPNSVTTIGEEAFSHCTSLTSVTIPNSVTVIGYDAFGYCTSLTSVTIPNSVTAIGDLAFLECYNLKSVTIPNSVTKIGDSAFGYCTSLTSVTIPNSVTSIGNVAFSACTKLTKINVAEGNPNYCSVDGILYNKNKTEIIQCPGGKSGSFTIPNGVTKIGYAAFLGCKSLTSVTIPNSVTAIGDLAFLDCYNLKSVTIPNSVTKIGDSAFGYCTSLTSVTIPNSVTEIGDEAFWGSGLKTIYGVKGSYAETYAKKNGYEFKEISGTSNTPAPADNGLEIKDGVLVSVPEDVKSVVIPDSVTAIGDEAFYNCTSLTSVTIPNSVTKIGDRAFGYCKSLTSVTIPNSVTEIGKYAFGYCTSLTSVTIPNSVTEIGYDAFCSCTSLVEINVAEGNPNYCSVDGVLYNKDKTIIIRYPNGKTGTITTINGVTEIGACAFDGCTSLTSITIPNGVTQIGIDAFWGSGLKTIYGVKGSYAETYAKENGYEFKEISGTSNTPAQPANIKTSSATANGITLTWGKVNGATAYIIMYSTDGGKTWTTKTATGNTITLTGLTPNTSYTYKVAAKNGDTVGTYTSNYTFKTADGTKPVQPAEVKTSAATANGITLTWGKVNGATAYIIMYSTDGGKTWTTKTATGNTITLTGLTPNTSYTYKVAAKNGDTVGTYTPNYTFKTTDSSDNSSEPTSEPTSGTTSEPTSTDTKNPETGIPGIAAAVGVIALAAGAVIVAKKRK